MTILRSTMIPSSSATKSTKAIFNKYAISNTAGISISSINSAIATASGAMTTNTLKSFLNISGVGGQMIYLTIRTADATARTIRTKLTIDGIAYDFTSAIFGGTGQGIILSGADATTNTIVAPPIFWRSTFVIEVASSLTETDKLIIEWIYNTEG